MNLLDKCHDLDLIRELTLKLTVVLNQRNAIRRELLAISSMTVFMVVVFRRHLTPR